MAKGKVLEFPFELPYAETVRERRVDFARLERQGLAGGFGAWRNKAEKGQGDAFFHFDGAPVTLSHCTYGGSGFIQDIARNAVDTQQIRNTVYHGDVFGGDDPDPFIVVDLRLAVRLTRVIDKAGGVVLQVAIDIKLVVDDEEDVAKALQKMLQSIGCQLINTLEELSMQFYIYFMQDFLLKLLEI